MIENLKKEIKLIKWPKKDKIKKDIIIVLISSSGLMLATSLIKFIAQFFTSLIF